MADKAVKPIPEGYRSVNLYLCVDDAARAIDFYKEAFGATERMRMEAPGGKIGHAEIQVGDTIVMLADEMPEMNFRSPRTLGGPTCHFMLYVEDVDARVEQAVKAGATLKKPVKDEFYGERVGWIRDPFGHRWSFNQRIEDVSVETVKARFEAMRAVMK